ncbi:hypothetical protein SAV14893_075210 [Streptomyces avermitilis]|uniref:PPM-type phosphatase domain-containing protein n=1 Tax=Streptomyces avermitilis TaxID=33903 RepID=A0A4D4M8H2_STRAX|nr:hypothetical protein SAV14893_075210 [Streptomyces avermitilis]
MSDEPGRTLTALHDELLAHVGGRLHDDAALLLLRKPAVPVPASDAGCGSGSRSVPSRSRSSAEGAPGGGSQAADVVKREVKREVGLDGRRGGGCRSGAFVAGARP